VIAYNRTVKDRLRWHQLTYQLEWLILKFSTKDKQDASNQVLIPIHRMWTFNKRTKQWLRNISKTILKMPTPKSSNSWMNDSNDNPSNTNNPTNMDKLAKLSDGNFKT